MGECLLEDRLKRIEDKLDAILDHFQIKCVDSQRPLWQKLADEGKRFDSVKAYIEQYDLGMREALDAVELYQRENG